MELNIEVARKVLSVVDAGLVRGKGVQQPGMMCVEAAVCYAIGLPHSDEPPCVGEAVRYYKIQLNDSSWSSDQARAKGMRRVAIAQLGSNEIDQRAFADYVVLHGIKRVLPIALRAAASRANGATKAAIEATIPACENATGLASAREAAKAAHKVASAASASASAAYAYAASASAAAYADAAAAASASASASAAAYADAAYAASADAADARDKILSRAAEIAVESLQQLKSPGCEWLHLCDEVAA